MKVTLQRVQNKAIADPGFFKALRTNLDRALEQNKLELSRADYQRLQGILALDGQNMTIDIGALMKRARRTIKVGNGLFWMGFWEYPGKPGSEGPPASKLPL